MPVSPSVLARYKAARRADPLIRAETAYQAAKWQPKYKLDFSKHHELIHVGRFHVHVKLIVDAEEPVELADPMRYPTPEELLYNGGLTRRNDGHQFNDGRVLIDADHLLVSDAEGDTLRSTKARWNRLGCSRHEAHQRALAYYRDRADFIDKVLNGYIVNHTLDVRVYFCGIELGRADLHMIEIGYGPHDLDYLNETASELIDEAVRDAELKLTEMRA